MKVLVTGGAGFLGAHITEHFLKRTAFDVAIVDRLTYASAGFDRLRDIKQLDNKRLQVLGADLSQPMPEGVARELGGEISYIIHAAAETHVDNSIVDPVPFYEANVLGTHHLLWWARGLKNLRRVFLVSTDEVYGPADWASPGNTEHDPFRPANPYAAAKAGGEAVGMAYANTYKLPITIVNTMNLIGERQGAEKFVPLVIRKVLTGEKVLIHADPTCTRSGTRFYIHCRNFADALRFLVGQDLEASRLRSTTGATWDEDAKIIERACHTPFPPLKVHVGGERELSNLELAHMIADVIGKPLHYELVNFHQSRPGHDLRYALDSSLIRSMGWQQPLDIEHSLEKTVRWFLDNPRWLEIGIK